MRLLQEYFHKIPPKINAIRTRLRNLVRVPYPGTLAVFYDLGEYPASYDIVFMMVAAQSRALAAGWKHVHVYLVNGPHHGLRREEPDYESAYPPDQRNYVVSQVIETIPRLGVLCGRSAVRINAEDLRPIAALYPAYYAHTMENQWNPLGRMRQEAHAAWRKHEGKLALTAGQGARKLMADWLRAQEIHSRPVVLTLRDRKWSHGRNTESGGWREFLSYLRDKKIPAVLIPDTERVFESSVSTDYGLPACIPASINTELRLALCELARMNFTVNTGPGTMLMFSRARYRYFTNLDKSKESCSSLWTEIGLPPGTQLSSDTDKQKVIWEEDRAENLIAEFVAADERYPAGEEFGFPA